ncbi:hypothetical protein KIN20_007029 [Parelaphostrongylus tenuis]|uniref:Secreted protein n=1 Tax=Parelaphostrongylus tenuis TaxID=148309 RepID=A0AAD5M5V1_PARTN|nr:hypothetical protein KIN20_007029 [Parelaphostrongylus tenuis]
MRVKTVFVFAVCSFLFVVALESKKATDEVKNKKTKGGKDRNEECKAKMTMKAEKHREARTYSGIDSIPEGNVSKNIREFFLSSFSCPTKYQDGGCGPKRQTIQLDLRTIAPMGPGPLES